MKNNKTLQAIKSEETPFKPEQYTQSNASLPYSMTTFIILENSNFSQKWDQVFQNKDQLRVFQSFLEYYRSFVDFYVSNETVQGFLQYSKKIQNSDVGREINYIAKITNMTYEDVFLMNFVYEMLTGKLTLGCTSIVIKNEKNEIFHGRNLDFDMKYYYSRLSIQFDVYDQKNQTLLYSLDTFVGQLFGPQAIKYGKFAISLNQRSKFSVQQNLFNLNQGYLQNNQLIAKVAKEASSYQQAVTMLKETNVSAANYYIVSGIQDNEGCVIERDGDKVNLFRELDDQNWFLVQTNNDQDQKDPDGRYTAAFNQISQLGYQITEQNLFNNVLVQPPVFQQITIQSLLMNSKKNEINSTVWI